jgi:Zn-finger nucleic acid-binding protein
MRLEPDKDCLTCDYCHRLHFPEANDDGVRVLAEPSGEMCPVCALPLVHAALAGERIRYCTECRGMLIPMSTFVVLIEELRARRSGAVIPRPPDPAGLDRDLRCPACRRPMDTHFYAGPGNVIIDACSPCCLNWLDHGELKRIVLAPDAVRTPESDTDTDIYPFRAEPD